MKTHSTTGPRIGANSHDFPERHFERVLVVFHLVGRGLHEAKVRRGEHLERLLVILRRFRAPYDMGRCS